jgi:hypothetical protein
VRTFTTAEAAGYAKRTLIPRSLIYVQPKDRTTGDLVDFGFWNGTGDVTLTVTDGLTQSDVDRDFTSRGAVLSVGDVTLSDNLNVNSVQVSLSQLNSDAEDALRGYDMRNAPIQIYRALFDIANPRAQVAPARCRFVGFVNTAPIGTPAEGGQASTTLNCVGCTRELTRSNTDLRSDESQQRRTSGDRFFRWVAATGQVQVFWGQNRG